MSITHAETRRSRAVLTEAHQYASRRHAAFAVYFDSVPPNQWSLQAIGRFVQVSRSHLRRLCYAQFGVSPYRYIRQRRLQIAAALLLESRLSVKEAVNHIGAGDISHFTRHFAATFGCPPGQYAQRMSQRAKTRNV